MTLPDATRHPCDECPFRRTAVKGWLGPLSTEEWVGFLQSDSPIACHKTISVDEEWAPGTLQCRGSAIFRANQCKSPRDPEVVTGPQDRERVFARWSEFVEHHGGSLLSEFLAARR